jgi:uncharacterized protein (TIRG00374 family)
MKEWRVRRAQRRVLDHAMSIATSEDAAVNVPPVPSIPGAPIDHVDGAEAEAREGAGSPRLGRILRGLLWSSLLALVAAIAVGVWGDWRNLEAAFGRFSWTAFPIALGLTLVNASLRFLKWHYYVHRIGARPTLVDSALIFVAGFALSVTPGKTGEFLKAYLLSRRCGAPAWKAAPITIAERVTDGLAIVVLAGIGFTILTGFWLWTAGTVVVALAGCIALSMLAGAVHPERQWRTPALFAGIERWVRRLAERPLTARLFGKLRESAHGAAAILDPKSVILAVCLGVVSWSAESIALWNALTAFGLPASIPLLGSALVALNAGTLVGAASLLPGGAGAADATIAYVLVQHTDKEVAAAATLLIRLCTIWFGAILGVGALFVLRSALTPGQRLKSDR